MVCGFYLLDVIGFLRNAKQSRLKVRPSIGLMDFGVCPECIYVLCEVAAIRLIVLNVFCEQSQGPECVLNGFCEQSRGPENVNE